VRGRDVLAMSSRDVADAVAHVRMTVVEVAEALDVPVPSVRNWLRWGARGEEARLLRQELRREALRVGAPAEELPHAVRPLTQEMLDRAGAGTEDVAAALKVRESTVRRWMASGVPASRIDELERALSVHVSAQAAARAQAEAGAVFVAAMDDAGVEVSELADALDVSTGIVHKWRQSGLPAAREAEVREVLARGGGRSEPAVMSGRELRRRLEERGTTQAALALALGVAQTTVSMWSKSAVPVARIGQAGMLLADESSLERDARWGPPPDESGVWLRREMARTGVMVKDLAEALGVRPGVIGAWRAKRVPLARVEPIRMLFAHDSPLVEQARERKNLKRRADWVLAEACGDPQITLAAIAGALGVDPSRIVAWSRSGVPTGWRETVVRVLDPESPFKRGVRERGAGRQQSAKWLRDRLRETGVRPTALAKAMSRGTSDPAAWTREGVPVVLVEQVRGLLADGSELVESEREFHEKQQRRRETRHRWLRWTSTRLLLTGVERQELMRALGLSKTTWTNWTRYGVPLERVAAIRLALADGSELVEASRPRIENLSPGRVDRLAMRMAELTRSEVAEALGVNPPTVSTYFAGRGVSAKHRRAFDALIEGALRARRDEDEPDWKASPRTHRERDGHDVR